MAYSLMESQERPVRQVRTFLCDSRSDISLLPTQSNTTADFPSGVPAGSRALCTEDMSVWVLGNAGTWLEITFTDD